MDMPIVHLTFHSFIQQIFVEPGTGLGACKTELLPSWKGQVEEVIINQSHKWLPTYQNAECFGLSVKVCNYLAKMFYEGYSKRTIYRNFLVDVIDHFFSLISNMC